MFAFNRYPRMSRSLRTACLLAMACGSLCLAGCAQALYAKTPTGTFAGKIDVEWIAPNQFVYRPRAGDPLHFITADGKRIEPQAMFTDGGSIPRYFWSMRDLGPWDFAPGFIIHDWLFLQHHCKSGNWQDYSLAGAADILAEAIKTQMQGSADHDSFALWAIYQGVKTPIAQQRWDSGECRLPPPSLPPTVSAGVPPPAGTAVRLFTIDAARPSR